MKHCTRPNPLPVAKSDEFPHRSSPRLVENHPASVVCKDDCQGGETSLSPQPVPPVAPVLKDSRLAENLRIVVRATRLKLPILLSGESGTGKEVVAREIHRQSGRQGAFVAVNCAALPESLAFAELFGHADGAYTGARRGGAEGRVVEADQGTLLLDEIGDMPLSLQVTLLRLLDCWTVRPLGKGPERRVDVQLIAATNVDLEKAVAEGRFRKDLYYRINTIEMKIPPLRQREDFVDLVMSQWRQIPGTGRLSRLAVERLRQHPWNGNMRELKSVLYRMALRADGSNVDEVEVHAELGPPLSSSQPSTALSDCIHAELTNTLHAFSGNVTAAARHLGISRNTIYRKLQKPFEATVSRG
ncbi:MAG: hypothetical protein RJA34_3114 [Pseudomonadota bacterium]